jgi:hypothetical protein
MTQALFRVIGEKTFSLNRGMTFLLHALLPKSDASEEQGDVFFCYALMML